MKLNRREWSVEALVAWAAVLLVSLANVPFWRGALAGRELADPSTWRFTAGTWVALVALHIAVLGLVATRHTVRPLIALLVIVSAVSAFYMLHYGVVLDPPMLRNVLHTQPREAAELLGLDMMITLAVGVAVAALPWAVRLRRRPTGRALLIRGVTVAGALLVFIAALLLVFQDFGSLMRNQRALRYTLTPANALYSTARVLASDAKSAVVQRDPPEAAQRKLAATVAGATPRKPTLLVIVVGETVRAANVSLNGYARDTTPELAKLDGLIYFARTTACGTSTEVSVPCMFSPFGRAEYDEDRIRRHESLLHLLDRAGLRVVWLDNQTGCKGVCDGLEQRDVSHNTVPGLCTSEQCFDEILLRELQQVVAEKPAAASSGDTVVVMHQLGNHGPAYFRRYPDAFKRYVPACETNELRKCSQQEIVNAYDNAILYTDHLLTQTARYLETQRERYDVAMVYQSDHGESLGENGLYLHGLPYVIAPREQLEVPMFWWFGADTARHLSVDTACLRRRAESPASHDNLFHSVLGVLDVSTARYRPERDLFSGCRTPTR